MSLNVVAAVPIMIYCFNLTTSHFHHGIGYVTLLSNPCFTSKIQATFPRVPEVLFHIPIICFHRTRVAVWLFFLFLDVSIRVDVWPPADFSNACPSNAGNGQSITSPHPSLLHIPHPIRSAQQPEHAETLDHNHDVFCSRSSNDLSFLLNITPPRRRCFRCRHSLVASKHKVEMHWSSFPE